MNVRIPAPQRPTTDPDVAVECEQAVEVAVQELADRVIIAGWPPKAVFEAIQRVADRQAATYQADPDPADDPVAMRPRPRISFTPF
jgi:hypothetical protein